MKIYYNLEEFKKIKTPVVTVGTYDGVHVGHQVIIKQLKEIARKAKGETVLMTFTPHPRIVLYPNDNDLKLLNTLEEKKVLLEKAGIDHLIIYPFTKEFSRLSSMEFVRNILVNKIGVKQLVIGYNHHFGKNREGTYDELKEYCLLYDFEVKEISAQDIDNVNVSSTKIRKALHHGDIKTANKYLDYDYCLTGKVIEGNKIGKTIGFPTANIKVNDEHKLIPVNGVYAVYIEYEKRGYKGMLNIGVRPTVNGNRKKIEVNIFDFDKDIYNQNITLYFKAKIRDERKFDDLEGLKKQLMIDKNNSLRVLVK